MSPLLLALGFPLALDLLAAVLQVDSLLTLRLSLSLRAGEPGAPEDLASEDLALAPDAVMRLTGEKDMRAFLLCPCCKAVGVK